MWPFSQPTWKAVASSKQTRRNDEIQKALATLPAVTGTRGDEQYTSASASQIVRNISQGKLDYTWRVIYVLNCSSSGKWTAVNVVAAYIRRAADVQKHSNPITEG